MGSKKRTTYSKTATPYGEEIVGQKITDLVASFAYNINTIDLTTEVVSNGTVTQSDSMAIVKAATDSDSEAHLLTKRGITHSPGHEVYAVFAARFNDGGVEGAKQWIGLLDDENGFMLGYNGTEFSVNRRKNSVDDIIAQEDFVGDKIPTSIDFTKLNFFVIRFGKLAGSPITFEIMDREGNLKTLHKMSLAGTLTGPAIDAPNLPFHVDVIKTSGSSTVTLSVEGWHAGKIGEGDSAEDRFFTGLVGPNAVSTEEVLINFQNKATFQSKTNQIVAEGMFLGMASDGNKQIIFKIYKNLEITNPSWVDVDTVNSIMQKDIVGTVTPNDANLLFAFPLARSDSKNIPIKGLGYIMVPEDTVTVTAQSSVTNDAIFSARWRERF